MSKIKTKKEITSHKNSSIQKLDEFLTAEIKSPDKHDNKSADLLSYWISDYINFLNKEKTFKPSKLIHYRKGDIVKIHLGYRIGSEEGGLHYAVVVDVNNSKKCDTVTIIPLTSHKAGKKIHPHSVYFGTEIFQAIISKHTKLTTEIKNEIKLLNDNPDTASIDKLEILNNKLDELNTLRKNILKMKDGSIALVNQITTISKIRIYDPLYSHNVLYGIRLSPTTISEIDKKLCEMYISKC